MILTLDTDTLQDAAFAIAQAYTYCGGSTFLIVCLIVCVRWEEDISKELVANQWLSVLILSVFAFPVVLYWIFQSVLIPLAVRKLKRVKRVYL